MMLIPSKYKPSIVLGCWTKKASGLRVLYPVARPQMRLYGIVVGNITPGQVAGSVGTQDLTGDVVIIQEEVGHC